MIAIILLIIVVCAVFSFIRGTWNNYFDTFLDKIMILIGGGLVFILGSVLSLGVLFCISLVIPPTPTPQNCEVNIYSLTNKSDISGSFCLGSGYIDSRENYYMFVKNGEGFDRWHIQSDQTTIYMGNYEPKLKWVKTIYKPSKWVSFWGEFSSDGHYNLYAPEKTIIQKYSVE